MSIVIPAQHEQKKRANQIFAEVSFLKQEDTKLAWIPAEVMRITFVSGTTLEQFIKTVEEEAVILLEGKQECFVRIHLVAEIGLDFAKGSGNATVIKIERWLTRPGFQFE